MAEPNYYGPIYADFDSDAKSRFRQEVYGEDIGQQSWTTAAEQLHFAQLAGLKPGAHLLEVGCGAGGPCIFLASRLGLQVAGVDIDASGIAAAQHAAAKALLGGNAEFRCIDGGGTLPFPAKAFDAAMVIDAINHIPNRLALFQEMHRLLKSGGTLHFTDPGVITGLVTAGELTARSISGYFEFSPPGTNERLLAEAGFHLVHQEDASANAAAISARWTTVREKHRDVFEASLGADGLERTLAFTRMVHELTSSRKLSRIMYLARAV
jgi:cyclopropane fatty-acyl-phospholipid synthase-like methyltransferase